MPQTWSASATRSGSQRSIPIVNKRLGQPIAVAAGGFPPRGCRSPRARRCRRSCDFLGGFPPSASKGFYAATALIEAIPALLAPERLLLVNVASTAAGINMDAVALLEPAIRSGCHAPTRRIGTPSSWSSPASPRMPSGGAYLGVGGGRGDQRRRQRPRRHQKDRPGARG
jgi:uncharacterized protein (UPF0210 family)